MAIPNFTQGRLDCSDVQAKLDASLSDSIGTALILMGIAVLYNMMKPHLHKWAAKRGIGYFETSAMGDIIILVTWIFLAYMRFMA